MNTDTLTSRTIEYLAERGWDMPDDLRTALHAAIADSGNSADFLVHLGSAIRQTGWDLHETTR